MATFCYKGKYYTSGDEAGESTDIAQLLYNHPDPAEWRRLLQNAVFVQYTSVQNSATPSDELVEAMRQYIVKKEDRRTDWADKMTDEERELPEMTAALEHPLNFRRLMHRRFENHGWEWLCEDLEYEHIFLFLEHGFFVFSQGPTSKPPSERDNEFVHVFDLDTGLYSISCIGTYGTRIFEMQTFPRNWQRLLMLPCGWLEVAYAYTPTVKKKVLAELDSNFIWCLALETAARRRFSDCVEKLERVQEYLFRNKTGHWKDEQDAYAEIERLLGLPPLIYQERGPDVEPEDSSLLALKMALQAYSRAPSPFIENTFVEGWSQLLSDLANHDKKAIDYARILGSSNEEEHVEYVKKYWRERWKYML